MNLSGGLDHRRDGMNRIGTRNRGEQRTPVREDESAEHLLAGVTLLVGLLFALLVVPSDIESKTALTLPSSILAFALAIVPAVTIVRRPKSVFRAQHVVMMGPIYWLLLDPIQGRYGLRGIERSSVQEALIAIAVFAGGAWIACGQRAWGMPRSVRLVAQADLPTSFYFGVGVVAFWLAFCRFAIPAGFDLPLMVQALAGGRWDGPWQRSGLGGADAFLDHLTYFGYLLPPLVAIVARRLGWLNSRPIILMVCTGIISAFLLQSGGRRTVGLYFGSGLLVWFLEAPRIRLSTIVALAVVALTMLSAFELMLSNRNRGVLSALAAYGTEQSRPEEETVAIRVDDNFLRLAQMAEIFPAQHPYTTWRYVLWVAARPVPRVLWPGKPLDAGFDLPAFIGFTGASLSASVIGELYMAGGLVACAIGGWLYGRLAAAFSNVLALTRTSSGLIIYSIGVFAIFIGLRSMIELVLTSYVILAWVLLVRAYDTKTTAAQRAPLRRSIVVR